MIGPVVAPLGTLVLIRVGLIIVKVAGVPLKVTLVAWVKLYPSMVTGAPTSPLRAERSVIVGVTMKFWELVALPTVVIADPLEQVAG